MFEEDVFWFGDFDVSVVAVVIAVAGDSVLIRSLL